MARKKRRAARHCSKCGSTAHDARFHKRRAVRRNPVIGPVESIAYYRKGENPRKLAPWQHEAGDLGIAKVKSTAKLVAGKGGKVSISGMRWIPGVGLVG